MEKTYNSNQYSIDVLYHIGAYENSIHFIFDEATKTCAIVDPAWEPDLFLEKINDKGYTLTDIWITHWHGDHTQGNLALGDHATIVAHDNVRTRLLSAQEVKLFNMKSEPYPEQALPSVTYKKSLSLHINDEHVELIHLANGHTDGDSVVFFRKANVVHMGDHFFNGTFPFVDVGTGGNVFTLTDNIAKVLGLIDEKTKLIPGHGPLADKQDLQDFHTMLVATSSTVKIMAEKGKSLEQIQAAGLGAQWNSWAKFFSEEVWISIIHSSL